MPIQITLILLLTSSLLLTSTASSPPPPPPPSCNAELVSISPCLAYVSLPPNKKSDTASKECCDVVSNIFARQQSHCLCYLLRQPSIFGFPFNQTRLLSLPFTCNSSYFISLSSLCSGSRALPPLRSHSGSVISDPNLPHKAANSPSPDSDNSLSSPPEPIISDIPSLPPSFVCRKPDEVKSSSSYKMECRLYLVGTVLLSISVVFTIL